MRNKTEDTAKYGNGMIEATYQHIVDFNHEVVIDRRGNVLNMKVGYNPDGYPVVQIGGKYIQVHQIIAVRKFGAECIGMESGHLNPLSSGGSNDWDNIAIFTSRENVLKRGTIWNRDIKPILATCIETGKQLIFKSQREASRKLEIPQSNISKVISGRFKQAGGYRFERMEA